LDEGCEGGVVELDGAPLAAFGERVARGAGAQHVNLLRASLRRHAVQQLLHRGRRLLPVVDVHAYGLGDLFAAGDGFQLEPGARPAGPLAPGAAMKGSVCLMFKSLSTTSTPRSEMAATRKRPSTMSPSRTVYSSPR